MNLRLRLFFVLAFHNVLEYSRLNAGVNSRDDAYISYKNLMNFGPLTSELTGLICIRLYLHRAKIGLPTFIYRAIAFGYALENFNVDRRVKSVSDTSDINLVGFRPVTYEFVRLSCVQQSFIST